MFHFTSDKQFMGIFKDLLTAEFKICFWLAEELFFLNNKNKM